jgi:signal transduction histidine kinase
VQSSQGQAGEVRRDDIERELQSFSYTVAHDLAGDFRHVSEFSRLLLAETSRSGGARQRRYAEVVRAAAARCQRTLDQLLTYSRVQQAPLEPTHHDATPILRVLIARAAEQQTSPAEVLIEPLGEVYADPKLLSLAFACLVGNAARARRPGAPLRIVVRTAHDAETWRMRISDNAPALDLGRRESAFQVLERQPGDGAFAGTAGGLAICRRIARRHGGDAGFLNTDDGACVQLSLPRATSTGYDILV